MKYIATVGEVDGKEPRSLEVEGDNAREAWKNAFEDCDGHEVPLSVEESNIVVSGISEAVYSFDMGFRE